MIRVLSQELCSLEFFLHLLLDHHSHGSLHMLAVLGFGRMIERLQVDHLEIGGMADEQETQDQAL